MGNSKVQDVQTTVTQRLVEAAKDKAAELLALALGNARNAFAMFAMPTRTETPMGELVRRWSIECQCAECMAQRSQGAN